MQLDYLLFDSSDEETGACSFDAMASALPARLPSLISEVEAVLAWAHREFGAPSAIEHGGEWDFELSAVDEDGAPLELTYQAALARVLLPRGFDGRVTLTLTIAGSAAFGTAFRDAFSSSD